MNKTSNYTDQGQNDFLQKQNIVVEDVNGNDIVECDRIDWLKELYAAWQEKRNPMIDNEEIFIINEPEELDIED